MIKQLDDEQGMEYARKAVEWFLSTHGVDTAIKGCSGEVPEFNVTIDDVELSIGACNREIAVYVPDIEEPFIFYVDSYGDSTRHIVVSS